MSVLRFFFRAYPWQTLLVVVCLLLAALAGGVGLSTLIAVVGITMKSDGATAGGAAIEGESGLEAGVRDVLAQFGLEPTLTLLLPAAAVAFWLKSGLVALSGVQVGYTVAQVATDLRLHLLRALLSARWAYFTRQPVGAVANAIATEADRGSRAYLHLAQAISSGIQALVYTGLAMAISWHATAAAAVAGALTLALLNAFVRMASLAGRRQTKLLKSLLGRLTDGLQAVKLLKATGRETLIGPLLEKNTRRLNKALRRKVLSKEMLRSLQEPIVMTCIVGGLYVALVRLGMAVPSMVLVVLLAAAAVNNINKTQRKFQLMAIDSSGLWSLRRMTDRAAAEREPTGGSATPSLDRGLVLEGVGLRYDGRGVLHDLSLEIPSGCITAVIGPSGAGKTSIVDLITGLVRPDSGEVRIDGVPLGEIDLRRWRRMIGYVPQETLMLHDSVRTNVTLGDAEVSEARLEEALRDAGAWDFVAKLPEGVDASLGERGSLLSGGQRQRIAIARALVHEPRLLILDEATTALDPESEAGVLASVERLRGKTTVIAISHQPALVDIADRVYRVEGGTVTRVPTGEYRDPTKEVA